MGPFTRSHEKDSPSPDSSAVDEKNDGHKDLEQVRTVERVGTHENYYNKGGLRTEGDGVDHVGVHHKVCIRALLIFV